MLIIERIFNLVNYIVTVTQSITVGKPICLVLTSPPNQRKNNVMLMNHQTTTWSGFVPVIYHFLT